MRISIVVAMDRNGVIGRAGRLPWHLPADLKHFRSLTMGKPVLMGRKTHESIGKPLAGRDNIVLTRQQNYAREGCLVAHSLEEALRAAESHPELMVIGGAEVFRQTLPIADRMYVTHVDAAIPGETRFPAFERSAWRETSREAHNADAKNPFDCAFATLVRA